MSLYDGYPVKYAPITLKKNVWLGWRVTILPGVTVGENSILQADTLVTKNVPENSIVMGNPAKIRNLYVFRYSIERKYKIIQDIMKDFVEYMNYLGTSGNYNPLDNYSIAKFETKKKKLYFEILIWHNPSVEEINSKIQGMIKNCKNLVVILFSKEIYPGINSELKNRNINFFDLESKILFGPLHEYTEDVRMFLQRSGITFDY